MLLPSILSTTPFAAFLQLRPLLLELYPVSAGAYILEADLDDVAILHPQLGVSAHSDTRGRAREYYVTGQQRGAAAQEGNRLPNVEYLIGSIALL